MSRPFVELKVKTISKIDNTSIVQRVLLPIIVSHRKKKRSTETHQDDDIDVG